MTPVIIPLSSQQMCILAPPCSKEVWGDLLADMESQLQQVFQQTTHIELSVAGDVKQSTSKCKDIGS